MSVVRRTSFCLCIVVLGAQSVRGQEIVEIESDPSCKDCVIQLEEVIALGSATDSFSLSRVTKVTRNSQGRYYVAPVMEEGRVVVYGSTGQLEDIIGSFGPGPRELGAISRVVVDGGDSIHVFHMLRHTVFSPSHEYVRTALLDAPTGDVARLSNGQFALTSNIATRGRIGYPLHIIEDDSITLSFGALDPTVGMGEAAMAGARQVASDGSGGLWLTHINRYRLERWDLSGQLRLTLVRDVSWFPPWRLYGIRPMTYQPKVFEIQVDSEGLLWILVAATKPGFKEPPRVRPTGDNEAAFRVNWGSIDDMVRYWDTIIEVIDPNTGRLIVSQRLDGTFRGLSNDHMLSGVAEGPQGEIVLRVYRMHIGRP